MATPRQAVTQDYYREIDFAAAFDQFLDPGPAFARIYGTYFRDFGFGNLGDLRTDDGQRAGNQ